MLPKYPWQKMNRRPRPRGDQQMTWERRPRCRKRTSSGEFTTERELRRFSLSHSGMMMMILPAPPPPLPPPQILPSVDGPSERSSIQITMFFGLAGKAGHKGVCSGALSDKGGDDHAITLCPRISPPLSLDFFFFLSLLPSLSLWAAACNLRCSFNRT